MCRFVVYRCQGCRYQTRMKWERCEEISPGSRLHFPNGVDASFNICETCEELPDDEYVQRISAEEMARIVAEQLARDIEARAVRATSLRQLEEGQIYTEYLSKQMGREVIEDIFLHAVSPPERNNGPVNKRERRAMEAAKTRRDQRMAKRANSPSDPEPLSEEELQQEKMDNVILKEPSPDLATSWAQNTAKAKGKFSSAWAAADDKEEDKKPAKKQEEKEKSPDSDNWGAMWKKGKGKSKK